ncbi:MAG: hypothetical protein GWN87_02005, partial [Desulfuromonadales bacterium]|nr:hypothetical protein [Desulfuromonadales bacterium]
QPLTPKDIAAPDDDANLHAKRLNGLDLLCQPVKHFRVDAEIFLAKQSFATHLQ